MLFIFFENIKRVSYTFFVMCEWAFLPYVKREIMRIYFFCD